MDYRPPSDAYSRVTNSERFRGLHELAESWLTNLLRDFDVDLEEAPDAHRDLLRSDQILRSVRLQPRSSESAPLTVTFTAFPALVATFGNSITHAFPPCGCDACAETLEGESERFSGMVASMIAGGFTEGRRGILKPSYYHEFRDLNRSVVEGGAASLPDGIRRPSTRREAPWNPWPRRSTKRR